MLNFENTPVELWVEITKTLQPLYILRLSQVCQALRRLISQKDIWIPTLRAFCRGNRLFMPSYPVNDMDLAQIQRAALGLHLWIERAKDCHSTILEPVHTVKRSLDADFTRRLVFLVPGGRFLVTLNHHFLKLEDLGIPGQPLLEEPTLVAQANVGLDTSVAGDMVVVGIGKDKLRVSSIFKGKTTAVVRVHDISLSDAEPSFQELGSLSLTGARGLDMRNGVLSMSSGRLFIQHPTVGIVWDLQAGHYSLCPKPVKRGLEGLVLGYKTVLAGTTVMSFTSSSVQLRRLSFDKPSSISTPISLSQYDLATRIKPVDFTLRYPFELPPGDALRIALRTDWYQWEDEMLVFDAMISPGNSDSTTKPFVVRCRVDVATPTIKRVSRSIIIPLSNTSTYFMPFGGSFGTQLDSSRVLPLETSGPDIPDVQRSGNWEIYTFLPGTSVTDRSSRNNARVGRLWVTTIRNGDDVRSVSACLASGRSASAVLDHVQHRLMLHIDDYLA